MKSIIEYNKMYDWNIPIICPVCGGEVKINESYQPYCINQKCPRKTSHRFAKMFEILKIKGCGNAFIRNLETEEISVDEFLDMVVRRDSEVICELAGGKNGVKIIKQMLDAMEIGISMFTLMALLDYKELDEKTLSKIKVSSLEEFYNLTAKDFEKFYGIGEVIANNIYSMISEKKDEIEMLRKYFTVREENIENKLSGLSFCFTGSACLTRPELEKLVIKNGGTVKSSVTKNLKYLVNDDIDSTTSKNLKAKELGIPIISSTAFLKMLEEKN